MATRADFTRAVLAGLGIVPSEQNFDLLVAVMSFEDSKAANNPMDTTLQTDGSTEFNATGVRNYPTFEAGVAASVQSLSEGRYLQFRDVIRGADQTAMAMALANGGWAGTDPETILNYTRDLEAMCRTVELDRAKYYEVEVADSEAVPDTPVPVPPVEGADPPASTEETIVEHDAEGDAGAVSNDTSEAVKAAVQGKVSEVTAELAQAKEHIVNLEQHLAELGDLAK